MLRKNNKMHALGVSGQRNKNLYQYDHPNHALLERFETPTGVGLQQITIDCPEFTSVCPVTGQPDFGEIKISYCPDKWCVESKSLKLYLMGYRNHGAFHEACVQSICNALVGLLLPRWLIVEGTFRPRGGIAINPRSTYTREVPG